MSTKGSRDNIFGMGTYRLFRALACITALLPIAAEALWLHQNWERIPEHWTAKANVWLSRSSESVYFPLLLGTAVVICIALIGSLLRSSFPNIHPQLARAESAMVPFAWIAAAFFCMFGLLPMREQLPSYDWMWFIVVSATITIFLRLAYVADEARLRGEQKPTIPDTGYRLAGHLYYNAGDPALFVPNPNRFGPVWMLNLARAKVWAYLAAFLLIIMALVLILTAMHG